jgi:hypothetical protein
VIYDAYLSQAEIERWILDLDVPWNDIRAEAARSQPELLGRVRDSALIESYFPIFTPKALELLWDDPSATAVFSIQLYESYKHFHVFNRYLECVAWRPIGDEEIVEVRRRSRGIRYDDGTRLLTKYMMSEHFAAHSFFKDSRQCAEPVLAHILRLVSRDEVRHAQFAFDLLEERLRRRPSERAKVLEAARDFRHVGLDVVAQMPMAVANDFAAIVTVNQKLRRLTGEGIAAFAEPATSPAQAEEAIYGAA